MRTLTIPFHGDASAALRCCDEMVREAGFERDGADVPGRRTYANPHPWRVSDQHPLRLASAVEISVRGGELRLDYDEQGAARRTQALLAAVGFLALLLIVADFVWAAPMQPLHKVLLPVAPWPLLAPVLHRTMKLQAHRRWYALLHTAARLAGGTRAQAEADAPEREPQPV